MDADGNPGYIKAGADTVTPFSIKNGHVYELELGVQKISTIKLGIIPSEVYAFLSYQNSFINDNIRILKSEFLEVGTIGGTFAGQIVFSYDEQTNSVIINQRYPYSGWACVIIAIKL